MAVYTEVSFEEAGRLVHALGLGRLSALTGIRGGIENTNYFVDAERPNGGIGHYVLTVFERLDFEQLPFYLEFMKHLAGRGLPVPCPRADASGAIVHALQGKPAAVVDRLQGSHRLVPQAADCASLGEMLALLHGAGADFAMHQPNPRGLAWWNEAAPRVRPFLNAEQSELLDQELDFQRQLALTPAHLALPRGAVHADLFRDNVMFDGERLTGLFDFYFAGVDALGFDIAVCLNDWCIDLDTGRLDEDRASALIDAYARTRPLLGGERRLLPALLRGAALRFWLSRLWDMHLPRAASLLSAHDPEHFERVLRERVRSPWHPA
jgi:homoserine kinase type II